MASDDLDLELDTMRNIATALARLDAPARARTLVWLRLRFDLDDVPAEQAEAGAAEATTVAPLRMISMPAPIADYDDTLSVEGLGELFDRRGVKPPAEPVPQSVTGMLSGLVAEFQNLARDWDAGCDSSADEAQGVLPAAS